MRATKSPRLRRDSHAVSASSNLRRELSSRTSNEERSSSSAATSGALPAAFARCAASSSCAMRRSMLTIGSRSAGAATHGLDCTSFRGSIASTRNTAEHSRIRMKLADSPPRGESERMRPAVKREAPPPPKVPPCARV